MSRLPTDGADNTPPNDDIPVLAITTTRNIVRLRAPGHSVLSLQGDTQQTNDKQENTEITSAALNTLRDDETGLEPVSDPAPTKPNEPDYSPIRRSTFLAAQEHCPDCRWFRSQADDPDTQFGTNHDGYLVRFSDIDDSSQIVVPCNLRQRVPFLAHDSPLQGHPRRTRLYDTLRLQFYWPGMYRDVDEYVTNCNSCAKTDEIRAKAQHRLRLFPSQGPLEDVAMDLIGPLPTTTAGKRFILDITDRFTKLARAAATSETTAAHKPHLDAIGSEPEIGSESIASKLVSFDAD